MLDRLRDAFRAFMAVRGSRTAGVPAETFSQRRWESAQTTRLNESRWALATGFSINADLRASLEQLRTRCHYEAANNPFIEGVIDTYACDLSGEMGPILQVESENKDFARRLEEAWWLWFSDPDAAGKRTGIDLLRQWVRGWWLSGEFLEQIVTLKSDRGPAADGRVLMRLNAIAPRRLASPIGKGKAELSRIAMGVERDDLGRAIWFHIQDEVDNDFAAMTTLETRRIAARDIIHEFMPLEPGQARGVPWLATCLQAVADLRDFDNEVLTAQRTAAHHSAVMETTSADIEATVQAAEAEIEVGQMTTLPPGYTLKQLEPTHPHARYIEFRHERLAEIGRVVNMPAMMVLLDSSGHNYSSARFDGQLYQKGINVRRDWISRRVLNRLLDTIATELRLSRGQEPVRHRAHWTWQPAPHVDPLKEASAAEKRLMSGTSSPIQELARFGLDPERVVQDWKRFAELWSEAGVRMPPFSWSTGKAQMGGLEEDDEADQKSADADQDESEDDEDRIAVARTNGHIGAGLHRNGRTHHVA